MFLLVERRLAQFVRLPLYEILVFLRDAVKKLLSGFFPLRGGGYPPFPLSFFGHNDFLLRGVGVLKYTIWYFVMEYYLKYLVMARNTKYWV